MGANFLGYQSLGGARVQVLWDAVLGGPARGAPDAGAESAQQQVSGSMCSLVCAQRRPAWPDIRQDSGCDPPLLTSKQQLLMPQQQAKRAPADEMGTVDDTLPSPSVVQPQPQQPLPSYEKDSATPPAAPAAAVSKEEAAAAAQPADKPSAGDDNIEWRLTTAPDEAEPEAEAATDAKAADMDAVGEAHPSAAHAEAQPGSSSPPRSTEQPAAAPGMHRAAAAAVAFVAIFAALATRLLWCVLMFAAPCQHAMHVCSQHVCLQ
jgi:hypothetical protein